MTRTATLLLVALLAACTPASTSTDTAADEQAIRAELDGWNSALSSANDSLLATFYAEGAEMLPPGGPKVMGRDNIRAFWATIWPMKATLTMTPGRVEVGGDLAVESGTWTWTMPTPSGEQRDHGKYLQSWRRVDGTWRITADIWNSDLSPAAAAEVVKP